MTRLSRWMPAGVFLVALVLGLIRLRAQPLSFDELFTRDTATLSWSGIWEAARDTEAPHLVYYALLKPWLAVFGTSEWALRLPSVHLNDTGRQVDRSRAFGLKVTNALMNGRSPPAVGAVQ